MAKISEIEIPKLLFDEGAAPSTPAATNVAVYAKADGLLYSKDDAGVETLVSGGSGGALDLSGLTTERAAQGVSDYVAAYDTSAADERGFPVGFLHIGRGFTVVKDDCYFFGTTDGFDGGVFAAVGGTGAAISAGTGTVNHPGIVVCSSGTTTTGRCALRGGGGQILLGGGKVRFGSVFKLDTLSDATNRYTAGCGIGDNVTPTSIVDGVFFRYADDVNAGEWQGVCVANSVETTLDTNTLADTNWHTFEAEVNAAGSSVEFFIDGASVGTIATNIPTGAGRETGFFPAGIVKSAGTTARTVQCDAYWYIFEFTTAR